MEDFTQEISTTNTHVSAPNSNPSNTDSIPQAPSSTSSTTSSSTSATSSLISQRFPQTLPISLDAASNPNTATTTATTSLAVNGGYSLSGFYADNNSSSAINTSIPIAASAPAYPGVGSASTTSSVGSIAMNLPQIVSHSQQQQQQKSLGLGQYSSLAQQSNLTLGQQLQQHLQQPQPQPQQPQQPQQQPQTNQGLSYQHQQQILNYQKAQQHQQLQQQLQSQLAKETERSVVQQQEIVNQKLQESLNQSLKIISELESRIVSMEKLCRELLVNQKTLKETQLQSNAQILTKLNAILEAKTNVVAPAAPAVPAAPSSGLYKPAGQQSSATGIEGYMQQAFQKSKSDREQEEADAELARRLQAQLDQEAKSAASSGQNNVVYTPGKPTGQSPSLYPNQPNMYQHPPHHQPYATPGNPHPMGYGGAVGADTAACPLCGIRFPTKDIDNHVNQVHFGDSPESYKADAPKEDEGTGLWSRLFGSKKQPEAAKEDVKPSAPVQHPPMYGGYYGAPQSGYAPGQNGYGQPGYYDGSYQHFQ